MANGEWLCYSSSMADLVLTEIADGCAAVTMNRPEARNALSGALIDALGDAVATGAITVYQGGRQFFEV